MSEILLSPGVLARENDQSFIQSQPIQAGAAILGPTAKGPVGIPTLVTSYSEYQNVFGSTVMSGSNTYSYFTSISAYNYFQQGGSTLLVTRVVSGSYTAASSSLIQNYDTSASFVLETLAEGALNNSTGSEGSNGELSLGSAENIRWEIVASDTGSGTFGLLIRRGDDITTSKAVLETWTDLSLDPNSSNYIARVIGDQKQTVVNDGSSYYLQLTGSFANASRYVRVKSVNTPTINYFDNAGNPKSQYTGSIPVEASGTFGGAIGTDFNNVVANFYENINATNTQGLIATNYTTSINLLSNKDDFKYNVLVAPGLYSVDYSSPITTIINNAKFRGDHIAVVDMVKYGSTVSAVKTQATSIDSSYGATYWPWVMTLDPNTGRQVWVPASTMLPGVFAFNDQAGEAWSAPAGITRGGLGTILRAERKLSSNDKNILYTSKINPISTLPNFGVVIMGQKTLQKKASALDRINVRRLLIELKSYISQVGDTLVFEQNTASTRNNFLAQVRPYLESVQQRQGLYAFKVVMDESNNTAAEIDRNQLIGQIYIQPTRTAEFIYLDFTILPTGTEFPL
jgi:hypothetical protein